MHPKIYESMTLEFCAGPYRLYIFSLPRKSCPTPSSIFVPEKHCTTALECMPILSEYLAIVSLENYAH
jgi:hypothetical protein